jgi:hypothetical protein
LVIRWCTSFHSTDQVMMLSHSQKIDKTLIVLGAVSNVCSGVAIFLWYGNIIPTENGLTCMFVEHVIVETWDLYKMVSRTL